MSWVAVTWVGTTATANLATGTAATMIGGGLIGAGVGQLAGGNTQSTLMGAGIGAGAGWGGGMGYLGGAPAAEGAAAGSEFSLANAVAHPNAITSPAAQVAAETTTGTSAGFLSGGNAAFNAMLIGQAGMSLASAFGSQGSSFQQKVSFSKDAESLKKDFYNETESTLDKRELGDVRDVATEDIHKAKVNEENRSKQFQDIAQSGIARQDNAPRTTRGTSTTGGQSVRSLGEGFKARGKGLFSPDMILNNYRREGLMNAVRDVGNVYAIENRVAAFNYQGKLANWQAANAAKAEQGAAIGSAISTFGSAKLNQAYYNRMSQMR